MTLVALAMAVNASPIPKSDVAHHSKDDKVMSMVRWFFYNNGPDRVITAWRSCEEYQYYTKKAGRAALSMVKDTTEDELTALSKEPTLRLSSDKVKAHNLTKFSIDDLAVMYKNKAPILFDLLFSLASINTVSDRDPNVVVPAIVSMLLITKARTSNYLPKVFSLFLYSTGASKKVIEVFSSVGLTVSYNSVTVCGTLGYNVHLLGCKHISEEKADYHAARELLCHSFDALVIKIWQEEIGRRNLVRFAEQHDPDLLPELISQVADNILDGYFTTRNLPQLNGQGSQNSALFLWDMMFYLELSSAIKAGDIGRILHILKYLTIIFQAGKTKNYGAELLHLYCGLEHTWTKATRKAVFESWLAAKKTGNHMACKRLIKPKRQRQADMLEQQPGSPNDARPEHELSPDPETESTTDHAPESGSESDSDSEQELESEPESDEDRVEFDLDEFMESNL
ncbi:hypothetical protein BG005_007475 [Podila minutissima]|nr:hypothetical protein BG005_007475 [Podila minutissima]